MNKENILHSPVQNIGYTERTICGTFHDLRDVINTSEMLQAQKNIALSLVAEAQVYANRMEAKLVDVKEYESMKERYAKMKKETKEKDK